MASDRDEASVGGGLWLSYLFVLFYIAIAAGTVTHAGCLTPSETRFSLLKP